MANIFMMKEEITCGMVCFFHQKNHFYLITKMCHAISCAVNFYNAVGSLAYFENKNILFYFEKRSSLPQRWHFS
jgi:hypothetical protein